MATTYTVTQSTDDGTATVGSLPVRDEKGKKIGEVVFTAYTLASQDPVARPVTFATPSTRGGRPGPACSARAPS